MPHNWSIRADSKAVPWFVRNLSGHPQGWIKEVYRALTVVAAVWSFVGTVRE